MKEIKLSQNKIAFVDGEDFEYLNQWKWSYKKHGGYAVRTIKLEGGKQKQIKMHSLIMYCPEGMEIDHVDKRGWNNQKENLRICSHSQNNKNKSKQKNNTSGYTGVGRKGRKWVAYIYVNKKNLVVGRFENIIDAAKAYDRAAIAYRGEFANLNFPDNQLS